ncbi:MAG: DUF3164 family protein [Paracoccaceae bacterium]
MTEFEPKPLDDGQISLNGELHMYDAKGRVVPVKVIKGQDLLIDQAVRKIHGFGQALSEQMARFKSHTFEDIAALEAILAEQYDAPLGGQKGNMTLTTFDGRFKVQVQVADRIDFGPELQIAKRLIDECLNEWAEDADDKIRTIVTRAFNTDKEGQVNRSEVFMLLRLDFDDERWSHAMRAIHDAIRVVGTSTYVRCYHRPSANDAWEPVPLDMAKV